MIGSNAGQSSFHHISGARSERRGADEYRQSRLVRQKRRFSEARL